MHNLDLTDQDVLFTKKPGYCLACGRLRPLVVRVRLRWYVKHFLATRPHKKTPPR